MSSHDVIINTRQAAKLMGTHIETIRRLARKGAIPAFKVGKDWRYQREALLNWSQIGATSAKTPQLLVVDDDVAVCKQIRRTLEPAGWQVCAVHEGGDGLTCIQDRSIDLILLDLRMPGMSGPQFLCDLRKTKPALPVIIITGYPDSKLMVEAMAYGPLLLLAKPIERRQLLASVGMAVKLPQIKGASF